MTQWLIVDISTTGVYRVDAEKAMIEARFDVYRKVGFADIDEGDKRYCYIKGEHECSYGVNIDVYAAHRHGEALAELRKLNPEATLETHWKFEDGEWECSYRNDDYKEVEGDDYREIAA
jgi:hypothetical protein